MPDRVKRVYPFGTLEYICDNWSNLPTFVMNFPKLGLNFQWCTVLAGDLPQSLSIITKKGGKLHNWPINYSDVNHYVLGFA
jgi:hypothetical protein